MEKRSESRLSPDGALSCRVEWEKGTDEGKIHNISPKGALLEAQSDFGISRLAIILELEDIEEPLRLDAAIRWHAVSPQNETDHYGLVFRHLDDETQEKLARAIDTLTRSPS